MALPQYLRVMDYQTFLGPEAHLGQDISWQEFKSTLAQLHSILWFTPDALPHRWLDAPQHSYMAQYGASCIRCSLAWVHCVPPQRSQGAQVLPGGIIADSL